MDDLSLERRRPHHLPRERYEVAWQPVWFTSCTQDRRQFLVTGDAPDILTQVLDDCAALCGCGLIAWWIMPDHLHLLGYVREEGGSTWRLIEAIRRQSGYLLAAAGLTPPIWQRDFWDRHVRSHQDLDDVVAYILGNPVRAGLRESRDDWPHSALMGYPERFR